MVGTIVFQKLTDCFRLSEKLPELLSNCDYVCNVLPSTPATDGFLDGSVLSHCRHKVLLVSGVLILSERRTVALENTQRVLTSTKVDCVILA